MLLIIAYIIVITLTALVLSLGVWIGALAMLPVSIIGYIFPASFRNSVIAPICIFLGGIIGVGCSVAFGFFVFRWLAGPSSYGLGSILASTVPLLSPIRTDLLHARKMDAAREELIGNLQETRGLEQAKESASVLPRNRPVVFGYCAGLLAAFIWFFNCR